MSTTIPTPTPARLCVLKHVRDNAGHWASGFGVAVIHCWKLGWIDAAKNEHGQMIGHQITDTGRAILDANTIPVGILALNQPQAAITTATQTHPSEQHA